LVRARDGVEALDYLLGRGQYAGRDVSDLPAVALLDLKLPKLSGLEVLKAVRADERIKHLPIVILTSSNEEKDRLSAYDQFANSYVLKPVDYDQFVAAAAPIEPVLDGVERASTREGNIAQTPNNYSGLRATRRLGLTTHYYYPDSAAPCASSRNQDR